MMAAMGLGWRLRVGVFLTVLLAACGGGSGGAGDAPWLKAEPASGADAALTGTYWDPFAPGTGFFFESQGNAGVATFYVFESHGRAVWYSAIGSLAASASGSVFKGSLQRFEGGQAGTSTVPRTPTPQLAGDVTIQFAAGGSARVQLPQRSFDALKFALDAARLPSVPAASRPTVLPETGIYWNPAESGRGYTIEVINGYANIGVFHYDGSGQPMWHLVSAALAGNGTATGDFASYRNGQTLEGGYAAPARTAEGGFFQLILLKNSVGGGGAKRCRRSCGSPPHGMNPPDSRGTSPRRFLIQ
ncbi:hypothetical protein FN976_13320, partial [Caenimonas sedimenti]